MSHKTKVILWKWAIATWLASVLTVYVLQHVLRVWA